MNHDFHDQYAAYCGLKCSNARSFDGPELNESRSLYGCCEVSCNLWQSSG